MGVDILRDALPRPLLRRRRQELQAVTDRMARPHGICSHLSRFAGPHFRWAQANRPAKRAAYDPIHDDGAFIIEPTPDVLPAARGRSRTKGGKFPSATQESPVTATSARRTNSSGVGTGPGRASRPAQLIASSSIWGSASWAGERFWRASSFPSRVCRRRAIRTGVHRVCVEAGLRGGATPTNGLDHRTRRLLRQEMAGDRHDPDAGRPRRKNGRGPEELCGPRKRRRRRRARRLVGTVMGGCGCEPILDRFEARGPPGARPKNSVCGRIVRTFSQI